jgi:hypothetical protein
MIHNMIYDMIYLTTIGLSGFSGLVVSMQASAGRSRQIFLGVKILSMPSFGGEVKPSVPYRSFAACYRLLG